MREDLKKRILRVASLEEVVRRYIPLDEERRSGGRMLKGLCPFHADHHPSLCVRVDKQYYKCFSCGEGGDLFKFVMKMEGCSFREALEKLAGWYGLGKEDKPMVDVPRRLPAVTDRFRQPSGPEAFKACFSDSERNAQYEVNRQMLESLSPYQPEAEGLVEAYRKFRVGISSNFVPDAYRAMANRIIFPIYDEEGRLAGFAARYRGIPPKGVAKYINPSNEGNGVYQKGQLLFGLYQARDAIGQHGFVYVVEGYKDVLAMHAAGFEQTVALCGTQLTDAHLALLARYTRHVVLLLDGDGPGQAATSKVAAALRSAQFTVSKINLDPADDPDSLLIRLGCESFALYIRKETRRSRLLTYEVSLQVTIRTILSRLSLCLTPSERISDLALLQRFRLRLARVSRFM